MIVTRIARIFLLLFFICTTSVFATSVLEVSLSEMLQKSQMVFVGKVTDIQVRENVRGRIHTYVTFRIKEIIKGEYGDSAITLSFLGGTVGDVTSAVSDMQYPEKGEHGIYFVESTARAQVNPLYGWSQGHFIVVQDGTGADRVMTNRKLPITRVMDSAAKETRGLSAGVARGIVVGQSKKHEEGLTVQEFKESLLKTIRSQQ